MREARTFFHHTCMNSWLQVTACVLQCADSCSNDYDYLINGGNEFKGSAN